MSAHILTVTKMPDDEHDDVEYEVTCPRDTTACELWWECRRAWCTLDGDAAEEAGYDEVMRHGVIHKYIDGYWMTNERHSCALHSDENGTIWQLAEQLGLGAHEVDCQYEGDGYWLIFPLNHEKGGQ